MSKERIPPPHILRAQKTGDTETLRRGAIRSNQIQKAKKVAAEKLAEEKRVKELDRAETLETLAEIEAEEQKLKILEEELERQQATNENLISPDGEDYGLSVADRDEYRIGPRL